MLCMYGHSHKMSHVLDKAASDLISSDKAVIGLDKA